MSSSAHDPCALALNINDELNSVAVDEATYNEGLRNANIYICFFSSTFLPSIKSRITRAPSVKSNYNYKSDEHGTS